MWWNKVSPIGYVILGIFATITSASVYLLTKVLVYLDRKPIGMQTVIDILLKDIIYLIMVSEIFFTFLATLMNGTFKMDFIYAFAIILTMRLVLAYLIAALQSFLGVKSLVIFHGPALENYSDHKVQRYTRIFCFSLALLMVVGDMGFLGPNVFLDNMTGTTNEP